jgi:CRISPR-associated protein Cas2
MYVIIVYDIGVDRVTKVCQFLRQYLNWMQNSVFEGELTESELERIKSKLKKIINADEDAIIIYRLPANKVIEKETIGIKKAEPSSII